MTLKEILNADQLVIIDFYSADCPPCHVIADILKELEKQYPGKLAIYTVDQMKHLDVFEAFGIKSVPHLKLFKKGKPLWEGTGLFSQDELTLHIEKHL